MGQFETELEKYPELAAFLQAKTADKQENLYREMVVALLSCPGILTQFVNNISKDISHSNLPMYVDRFIDEQLLEISNQYVQLATTTPYPVLDFNEEKALQYYHILIYCIQNASPSLSSILPFLMAIPSVQSLFVEKKEALLEVIKQSANLEALKIVITLPEIRNVIEKDDHYCSGAWVSPSLPELYFDITTLPEDTAERKATAYGDFERHAASIKSKIDKSKIEACMRAIQFGNLSQVQNFLQDSVVSNAIDNSILEDEISVLNYALASGNAEIIRLLLKLEKISTTVAALNNVNLKKAIYSGYQEIVETLLGFPQVFALAEKDPEVLDNYVPYFIEKKLTELKNSKNSEQNSREARLCFYIARHLIRQNNLHDDLVFLLELPAVRAIAHTSVSFDMPNELFQVAVDAQNDFAKELLLQIPAVKKLVENENSEEAPTPKVALLSDLRNYCDQQEIMANSFFHNTDGININLKAAKHLIKILDGLRNTYKKELLTPLFAEPMLVDLLIKWQIKYDLCFDSVLCEKIPVEAREEAELSDYNSLNNECSDYSFSDGDSSEYDSSGDEKGSSMYW